MNYTPVLSKEKSEQIYKIVITGGPCAGKTTAISRINDEFSKRGYGVIIVSETATDLIMSGVAPWTLVTPDAFQCELMKLQLEKEKLFCRAAEKLKNQGKVLIVFDRGVLDGKAYTTTDDVYEGFLASNGLTDESAKSRYDAVFHLVTAAKGALDFYTLSNNTARIETPEEAEILDDKVISAWSGHRHFRIIGNETDFKGKLNRLISEISAFLGDQEPFEIERKFLIEYPDITALEKNPNCSKCEIIQTYLNSSDNSEIRVRMKTENGVSSYTKTVKKKISGIKRIELEQRISKEEYIVELLDADTSKTPVSKTRYCLTHCGKTFEIDIYPFWTDKAVMEVELHYETEEINFPKEIEIIKEVTGDDTYKNSALASRYNQEV